VVTSRFSLAALAFCGLLAAPLQAASDAAALIRQGEAQANAGQLDQALTTLQQAVTEDPASSLAYTRLGGVQMLKQEYRAGIQSFQQAITLDQTNANAFVGMGIAYLHLGDYALARAALQEAEQRDPSKQAEIARLQAWIQQRATQSPH
jgi:tetratricopeptide (TPR) repeat protein